MIKAKNPTLLNVTYHRRQKIDGKWTKERFEVIYKTEDGKVHKVDEPPNADIYFVKPEFRTYTYNKPEERIEVLEKVRCPISKIRLKIIEQMGEKGLAFLNYVRENHLPMKRLDEVYKWPYAYSCDFQPEYYYMKNWYEKYKLGTIKLTKAFLDIECDSIDNIIDMENIPNTAYSPVNLITIIFEETKEAWTLILKPYEPSHQGYSDSEYKKRYALYKKQKERHEYLLGHMQEFIDDLHQSFDPVYGHIDYHLQVYDDEVTLIREAFNLLNRKKPNFCMTWNMRFDIQYLYYRLLALNQNPADIMCDKDFLEKRCFFKVDHSTFLVEKQYDYFYCSSYIQYICQMRLYSSIRKSQHKLKSVSLNAIGDRELRDRKVEYPSATNIRTFPYIDWTRFIKYNIKDVLLQLGIERKTRDVMTYYIRSHKNLTPYNKIFKETHLLRNVREDYFERDGWIQGNNINIIGNDEDYEDRMFSGKEQETLDEGNESTFKGAIMADPIWNSPNGLVVLGQKTNNLFNNGMDYDMGAFYPSIKIASNMDPITLLYKAAFDNDEFISGEMSNKSLNQVYMEKDKNGKWRKLDITGEAVNTYVSGNILTFGHNYLNTPDITEFVDAVLKEARSKKKEIA